MGFVGRLGGRLPRLLVAGRRRAQCRVHKESWGEMGGGPGRGGRVAAGLRRGATRAQRACYAVATARKRRNRVADGEG